VTFFITQQMCFLDRATRFVEFTFLKTFHALYYSIVNNFLI